MEIEKPTLFRVELGKRIKELMDKADLTVDGFATFLQLQPTIIISVLKGEAIVPNELLSGIARAFGMRLLLFFNIGEALPKRLTKSQSLLLFKSTQEDRIDFFVSKFSNKNIIEFLNFDLLSSTLLSKPAYLSEILAYAKLKGIDIPVHVFIRYLEKMVESNLLIKNMALLKRKDGSYGNRQVAVYSRNNKFKK